MKQSILRLRKADSELMMARQVRYNELMGEVGNPTSGETFDRHKQVVIQLNQEQNAVEAEEGEAMTSASCYITKDGKIWSL